MTIGIHFRGEIAVGIVLKAMAVALCVGDRRSPACRIITVGRTVVVRVDLGNDSSHRIVLGAGGGGVRVGSAD